MAITSKTAQNQTLYRLTTKRFLVLGVPDIEPLPLLMKQHFISSSRTVRAKTSSQPGIELEDLGE
jgi:hypothetical protein